LTYVSAGQINAQAPADLLAGRVSLKVTYSGVESAAVDLDVTPTAPGLFLWGDARGAILNQDFTLNTPQNPAARGAAVILYATGQGKVDPEVADGTASPADPLARTPALPEVTVGGVPAQVGFSGLAPGFVGLWQINVVVPQSAPAGDNIPVRIALGGAVSNEGRLAVR